MYKLFAKLFGCEYVYAEIGPLYGRIKRVKTAPNGKKYFTDIGEVVFLDSPGCWKYTHLT